jgi:hemoglobin-like flavoprotein
MGADMNEKLQRRERLANDTGIEKLAVGPGHRHAPGGAVVGIGGEEAPKPPQLDVDALEISFDLLAPRREELVDRFYRRVFTAAPATRALFAHADMAAQKRALLGALVALRRALRDLSSITPFLAELGARHARYGVVAEHYPVVGAALLEAMEEIGGADWNPRFTAQWAHAYQAVADVMMEGARQAGAAA